MKPYAHLRGLSLMLLLGGCASTEPSRYYALSPQDGANTPYAGPPIQLARLTLPPELNRLELVDHRGETEIVVHDFARWAAPLPDLARAALEVDLARRLPEGQVIVSQVAPVAGAAPLSVTINALRRADGRWVMRGSWMLGGGTVSSRAFETSTSAAGAGRGDASPAEEPAAISALLGGLADQIAARLASGAGTAR